MLRCTIFNKFINFNTMVDIIPKQTLFLETTDISRYIYTDLSNQESVTPEKIADALNERLVKLGLKFDVSPDKSTISIDDKTKFIIKNLNPADLDRLSKEDLNNLIDISKTIDERKLPVIWKPTIPRMAFFHTSKKLIFNGANIAHLIMHNKVQSASALASSTGHIPFNYRSAIGTSFMSVVLLNLIECHVPYGRAKSVLKFTRNIVGFPLGITQYVYNYGFGIIEKRLFNTTLPINVTDTNLLLDGSALKDLEELKGPTNMVIKYITKKLVDGEL
jgi:hypothetical protein